MVLGKLGTALALVITSAGCTVPNVLVTAAVGEDAGPGGADQAGADTAPADGAPPPPDTRPPDTGALDAGCEGASCAAVCSPGCQAGFICVGGSCEGRGPVLHWRLDEAGTSVTAIDSSGNGFDGTYFGEPNQPTPSTDVAPVRFPNPSSRAFGPGGRPVIRLLGASTLLGAAPNGLTVSVWFRASSVTPEGSDVFNLNVDVMLRLKSNRIEVCKRRSLASGAMFAVASVSNINEHLDGAWHHLVGVIAPDEVRLYLDGMRRGSFANADPLLRTGNDLQVGRSTAAEANLTVHDFQGNVDDLRLYRRPLTDAEINSLWLGFN